MLRCTVFVLLLLLAAATTACAEDPLVYITETGEKYHREGCRYLERSRIPIPLSTAVSMGYDPCGHCNPPPPSSALGGPAESRELYRLNVAGVEQPGEADLARMTRAVVVRHVDGDTVYVSIPRPPKGLKRYESLRFIGVDTPETVHPQKTVERFGKEASEFTRGQLLNRPVYLAFDWQLRDRYDRLLAYIYLPDGICFNAVLVREGYAHAYTRFPFQFLEQFRALERSAREQGRGLWGSEE
ncbi:MAG: thermonuclease family protein [Spirochaetaceae bacterium]|nr:MAG: thermonuclease family protein [Spirochaetaceae bacterium]